MIIIILLSLCILPISIMAIRFDKYEPNCSMSLFITILILVCLITYNFSLIINQPKAIDVYRGKTELQITYKGTIPIDSVVVFKNK